MYNARPTRATRNVNFQLHYGHTYILPLTSCLAGVPTRAVNSDVCWLGLRRSKLGLSTNSASKPHLFGVHLSTVVRFYSSKRLRAFSGAPFRNARPSVRP